MAAHAPTRRVSRWGSVPGRKGTIAIQVRSLQIGWMGQFEAPKGILGPKQRVP